MIGPSPKGTFTASSYPRTKKSWGHLEPGRRYRIAREFFDNDMELHPVGETWLFLGYSYHQMDEGLSLFVSFDDEQEWHIPMQGGGDQQGPVLDYLEQYITEVKGPAH